VSDFNPVFSSNTANAVDMPRNIAVAAIASVRHPLQSAPVAVFLRVGLVPVVSGRLI
jgi:hypothetical protein